VGCWGGESATERRRTGGSRGVLGARRQAKVVRALGRGGKVSGRRSPSAKESNRNAEDNRGRGGGGEWSGSDGTRRGLPDGDAHQDESGTAGKVEVQKGSQKKGIVRTGAGGEGRWRDCVEVVGGGERSDVVKGGWGSVSNCKLAGARLQAKSRDKKQKQGKREASRNLWRTAGESASGRPKRGVQKNHLDVKKRASR